MKRARKQERQERQEAKGSERRRVQESAGSRLVRCFMWSGERREREREGRVERGEKGPGWLAERMRDDVVGGNT